MKPLWLWILGGFFLIWLLSDSPNKAGVTSKADIYPSPDYTNQAAAYSAPSYMGYPCTVDCSGHEAGYEWAEDNGITYPDDCDGNSDSFIEGCRAYAEEQLSIIDDGVGYE